MGRSSNGKIAFPFSRFVDDRVCAGIGIVPLEYPFPGPSEYL